ncbi:MAG: YceI family protein [Chloroflexota bacterium]
MTTETQIKTSTWNIDKSHSNIDFTVKHLVISTVRGHFRDFEGVLHIDEDAPENSNVTVSIDVASVDTNDEKRDAHVRSEDFFAADRFPKATFQSTRLERLDGNDFRLHGDLSIRGITKPVVLDGEFDGQITDPWGGQRIAFTAKTEISREAFDVRWNQVLEAGGMTVSDKVKLSFHIEAVKAQESAE